MKLLFLDVDGVLNSTTFFKEVEIMKEYETITFPLDSFDYRAIALLNHILNKTDAKLVISSDWRFDEDLESCLKYHGLKYDIYGITPYDKQCRRGIEIQEYILSLNKNIESYCIIDDIDDWFNEEQLKHTVKTTFQNGLNSELAEKAIEILNGYEKI